MRDELGELREWARSWRGMFWGGILERCEWVLEG